MGKKTRESQRNSYQEVTANFDYPLPDGKFPFTPEEYGKRLMKLRKSKGMTQKEVADYLKISIQAISKIELGKVSINPQYIDSLAKLFDCTKHYLVGYTDDPHEYSVDGAKRKLSIAFSDYASTTKVNHLLLRAHTDPELFDLILKLFDVSKSKREDIKSILAILLKI